MSEKITSAMQQAESVDIVWSDGTQISFPYLWLRDNCGCGDCRVEQTTEKRFLPPHNDFASYSWPPSVQALHMLVNEVADGESVFVDGWQVLRERRAEQPDMFDAGPVSHV